MNVLPIEKRVQIINLLVEGNSMRATSHIANAFSRYEKGKTKPPLALVKLLKVLDRHPDLLNEVKAA